MSKIIKFVALAAFFVSATASAQSKFDGAYGQVGIGYESVSPSYSASGSIGGTAINGDTSINTANSFTGVVTLGFMTSITKDFLLGAGVEYSPIAGQKANYSAGAYGTTVYKGQYNKENSYNIFISPAMPVGQDGLLYGKVGYTGASIKDTYDGGSSSSNYQGYSLGAGYKQIIQGGLYGFGEFNYSMFGDKTNSYSGSVNGRNYSYSMTSSANVGNIIAGIGYKF